MKISRQKFLLALTKAMPGIDMKGSILDGSDAFLFKDKKIYSYNDRMCISVDFDIGIDKIFAIKAKELYSTIKNSKAEEIEINYVDGENCLKLEIGRANARLYFFKDSLSMMMANMDQTGEFSDLPVNFAECIMGSIIRSNKSKIAGIFVDGNAVYSTDEMSISCFWLSGEVAKMWLPEEEFTNLFKIGKPLKYKCIEGWIIFIMEDGTKVSCRRLQESNYPLKAIKAVISAHKEEDTDIHGELPIELIAAMERASAFASEIEDYPAIKLKMNREKITILSECRAGEYEETIDISPPISGNFSDISFYINHNMVENGMDKSRKFYIKKVAINGKETSRLVFASSTNLFLISTLEER